jgi:hypothetical protein
MEVARHDAKVHHACRKMVESMVGELAALGIPFFGTKASLIKEGNDAPEDSMRGPEKAPGEARLLRRELDSFRKRMLDLLEDMCRE